MKKLEPYTPWSNAAEREIKELKKGVGNTPLQSGAPKHLWDYCLELEAYIRSNTAHEIYNIYAKVMKTEMSDKMTETSQFCLLQWFECICFEIKLLNFQMMC